MITSEEWRPVVGFPDYVVSNLGRVLSFRPHARAHARPTQARELMGKWSGDYRSVVLSRETEFGVKRYVHHLVAEAFHGPRPEGAHIRHLDGNARNNSADNLRYGTQSENMRDTVRHGTNPHSRKTHCPQGHPYDEANTVISLRKGRGTIQRRCRACRSQSNRNRSLRLRATRNEDAA